QDEIFRKSEGPRDRLTGGQPEGLPSLQVALGERVDLLRDRVREDADAERELRIDLPARLRFELAPVELEKPRPLDHVPRGEFPEAPQVLGGWLREDRDVLHLVVELVFPADHAVPEPVRADGELDGHEWALRPVEEPREDRERLDRLRLLGDRDLECDGMEDVLDHFGPDEPREEVVDHGPLVMPADDPASLVEPPIVREARDRRRVGMAGLSPAVSASPVGSGSTIWRASASRSLSSGRSGGKFRSMRPKRPSKDGDRETALKPRSSEPWKGRVMFSPGARAETVCLA